MAAAVLRKIALLSTAIYSVPPVVVSAAAKGVLVFVYTFTTAVRLSLKSSKSWAHSPAPRR